MGGVLAAHRLGEGAAVGLCLDEHGHMFLGVNSSQVRDTGVCATTRQIVLFRRMVQTQPVF